MSDTSKQLGPSASIKKYIQETLELESVKKPGKKTAEGATTGAKEITEFKRRIRNNTDAKGRAIDNLFESIANVTYFFQFVNSHPELVDKFRDDIEDMMGDIIKSQQHLDSKHSPLGRLIRELIGLQYPDENFAYRTRLLHTLQFLISRKSDEIMMKFGEVPNISDYGMRALMGRHMKEAQTWIGNLDKFNAGKTKRPKRVLDF